MEKKENAVDDRRQHLTLARQKGKKESGNERELYNKRHDFAAVPFALGKRSFRSEAIRRAISHEIPATYRAL